MSLLQPDAHHRLVQLLQGLQSPDNVTRSAAETALANEWVTPQPEMLLMGLAEQMQAGEEVTRSFSAVLFRKMAARNRKGPTEDSPRELFLTLEGQERMVIRAKLLECLANEKSHPVRNKIGDAVAEIAGLYSNEDEQWPELLGALFHASNSTDAGQRETAFRIFAASPAIIEKQHEGAVLDAFTKGFKDDDIAVRLAAIEAFASFFQSIQKKAQPKYFRLIGDVLSVLPPLKSSKEAEHLIRALIALIDLAEVSPKMFKDHFHDLVTFSIGVVQDKELDDQARQNALELMSTFADNSPAMCRKDPSYTSQMVTQCLSLMTDVGAEDDDAEEWNASEDLDIDESDMNHVAGEQCMDRLANKLGGQTLLPPTFQWLPQMMSSTAWRDRHAALMAISAISEGCRELMTGELDKVLDLVIPSLRDPHPRVRWAGCNALGQMSTDFAGTMQEKYHSVVVPAIIPVLESPEPRVQSHAAAALVNFCEEAEKEILEPYLDNLLSHLLILLESPRRFVQEQALSTIATIADSAEVAFSRYYDTLMPLLFNVLRDVQDKEFRLLRAKAMECATLIALAVGKMKMGQDALSLVQLLGSIQENITDADDPQAGYLLHSWGRMCRVLGQDFVPYLPGVVPPLIQMASANADIQLIDDEEEIARIECDDGWELVPLKGKFIGIKTSLLDDKNTAIELIVVYAQHLEAAFEPYVNNIMDNIAIPGLAFFFHDPVRVAAAKAIPQLLNSCKKAHGDSSQQLQQLWAKTAPKLLEVLTSEPTIETLAEMYQSFYESIDVMGKDCLLPELMETFCANAQTVLAEYWTRCDNRAAETGDKEDGDEESEDLLLAIEDDQTLLSDMNKAFHTIMKQHSTAFLPYWETLMPFYNKMVASSDATNRQWALCIFDDVLEFCGEQSWSYSNHFIQPLVDGMRDQNAAIRQAAAYGAGVAAQRGGAAWSDFANASLPLLFQATKLPEAREEDHVYATENACASIAKVLHLNSSKVANVQEVVNHWIDTLPVTNDDEAAPFAYNFLAELIDRRNPAVITAPAPARVFRYIAEALAAETIQGATALRVVGSAKSLVQATGLDGASVVASLPVEMQGTVRAYFS